MIDFGLYTAYALIAVASLGFIGFEILHLVKNFADAKVTLAGVAALVVILGISYAMGSGDFTFPGIEKFDLSSGNLKMIDAGLFATYLLVAIAGLALIADLVMGFVKK